MPIKKVQNNKNDNNNHNNNRPCKLSHFNIGLRFCIWKTISRPFYILKIHRLKAHFVEMSSFQSIFTSGSCMGQNLLYTRQHIRSFQAPLFCRLAESPRREHVGAIQIYSFLLVLSVFFRLFFCDFFRDFFHDLFVHNGLCTPPRHCSSD